MPKYPEIAPSIRAMTGSVYSSLAHRLEQYSGQVYPFHIGDTWMEPAVETRMEALSAEEYPGMHRYAPVQGRPELLDAISERIQLRTGVRTEPANVLVTAGATGALGAVIGAIVEPGDEVILLAPYWPLIAGIVRAFRGRPVDAPVVGAADSPETLLELVQRALSPKTVAIYWSTPNNPSGLTLPKAWIEILANFAERHNLWILADEVYEDYVFEGDQPYALPFATDKTFSIHSFSKAFGMAGLRCGYVVGPRERMAEVRKVSTHTFYSTPTPAQISAYRALGGPGDQWAARACELYRDIGRSVAERLGVDPPEGSTFLFLNVAERLDGDGLLGFLTQCVDRGLLLAPGPSFGPYPEHVRLCYTAAPPEVTHEGVGLLAGLLGR